MQQQQWNQGMVERHVFANPSFKSQLEASKRPIISFTLTSEQPLDWMLHAVGSASAHA